MYSFIQNIIFFLQALLLVVLRAHACEDTLGPVAGLTLDEGWSNVFFFSVYWSPPVGQQRCVSGYTMCWGEVNTSWWACRNVTERETINDGPMRPCSRFLLQVFARDKNGNPGENETLIYESGAEDVSDISVSNKTEDSLYLSWHSSEDSLTCTEYYTVSWCVDEKQEWPATSCPYTSVNVSAETTEYNVTGLEACTQYFILVTTPRPDGLPSSGSFLDSRTSVNAVPGPVTNVTATAITSNSVTVSWDPPETGLKCVDVYGVCLCRENSAGDGCTTQTTRENLWTSPDDLRPCTNYSFVVAATDYDGNRAENVSITLETAPEAVADLSVDVTSSSSLHVVWDTSSSSPCTRRFAMSWCAVQEGRTDPCYSRDVAADTTEFEISGVSGCTHYLVSVLAVGGTGTHSSSSALGLTGVTVPGSVEDLEALVVDSDHFVVQWSPPVDNPNCATAYSVCYTTESSEYEVCDNTHYTTWGNTLMVEACTNYSITVAALDETSSRSSNYTITLLTAPERVANLTLDAQTVDSVSVVWTSSSALSDCTVAYTVSWCGVTSEWLSEPCNYTSTDVSRDVTWFNITGLDSCSLQRIFVSAVGPGDVKSTNTLVFGRTRVEVVPGPVTNITTISVTSTKIMIQWEQPTKSADCIDRYSVCFRNTARSNEFHCVTQVSTKKNWWNSDPLQPGTNYTIVVAAIDFDQGRSQNATVTLTTLRSESEDEVI